MEFLNEFFQFKYGSPSLGDAGNEQVTGELLIPAVQFGRVSGGLQSAGKQLQDRIEQARKQNSDQTEHYEIL